jgi:hypothetical protein
MNDIIFDENEDWEKRILCSDESCIGVIGPDGKCKECGKLYDGKQTDTPENGQTKITHPSDQPPSSSEEIISDEEWDRRVLCSDGTCIGVIGPDGKCKECGKPLN